MVEVKKYADDKGHFNGDYYYAPVVDGREYSCLAETEDMALLLGLGIKYDGGVDTKFPKMAARMLKIDSVWGD